MGNFINYNKSLGFQNPQQGAQSPAILSPRDPTTADAANPGQYWLNQTTHTGFICNGAIAGAFQWSQLAYAPGDVFPTLTVNPGPFNVIGTSNLTGPTNINTSALAATNIGTGSNTGQINIGNAASGGITMLSGIGGISATTSGDLDLISTTAGGTAVNIGATAVTGGVTIGTGTNGAMAIGAGTGGLTIATTTGGIGILTSGLLDISSTNVAINAIKIVSTNGGIDLESHYAGNAAIDLNCANAAGGVQISSGANGLTQIGGGTAGIALGSVGGQTLISSDLAASINSVELRASAVDGGIALISGTGGVNIQSGGETFMNYTIANVPAGFTAAIATSVGRAVFAALAGAPIGAGATQVLTIQNANITVNSMIICSIQCSQAADQIAIVNEHQTAGVSFEVTIQNVGAGATTGNVAVNFWILGY